MSGHKNLDFIVKDIVSTMDIDDNAVNNKKYFNNYIKNNIVEINDDKNKS